MSHDQHSFRATPDYRAMARHLASLSTEAAEMARHLGDPRYAALSERLKSCSDQIGCSTAAHGQG
jgi:hypothetical protein